MSFCKHCQVKLGTHQYVYCSNKCQRDLDYRLWIKEWKEGKQSGNIGINTGNISGHLKKYLHAKFKEKCSLCGWSKQHPKTGKVPLEIDHIDGNSRNNNEENLRLICPNCHSLTLFYKNYNTGNGRIWRKAKYLKNIR